MSLDFKFSNKSGASSSNNFFTDSYTFSAIVNFNPASGTIQVMRTLAIDTSCDETAAAVTEDTKVLSNTVWSQASAHAKFGGVMPSLAKRMHEERIDFVVDKALKTAHCTPFTVDCVAVTVGPGLSIALGVGINKAKELATLYKKPLIPINHIEAHLLSPFASDKLQITNDKFPMYGLCVSGGNTMFVLIEDIGKYKVLAETVDDALGEALDKGARMLGLGYPGGAVLEKMARLGNTKNFTLPIPLVGQEKRQIFSYSGLKASFYRLIESHKLTDKNFPSKEDIYNLSAAFQDVSFKHLLRVIEYRVSSIDSPKVTSLLLGGGVSANIELRKRLRTLGAKFGLTLHIPYTKKLCGDNAGMIGVCAFLKNQELNYKNLNDKYGGIINIESVDRNPRLKL